MNTTAYGIPIHDIVGIFDENGLLVLVEATPDHGERRMYYPHQVRLDHPLRRKGDNDDPEPRP